MKYANGGLLTQPNWFEGAEGLVAAADVDYERLGDFLKVLSLDWSLLELELDGGSILCLKQ